MKCLIYAYILTFGLLSTAWAQSAKPMSLEQLAAYNKPDREQVLYAGAKTEGQDYLVYLFGGGSYKDLAAAFEAKYPGVKVEAYRGRAKSLARESWRRPRQSGISSIPLRLPSRC